MRSLRRISIRSSNPTIWYSWISGQPWCGPCRAFGPTFEKASEANPDIYFAKVDIDQNPDLASAAKVQAVPTLMVIKNQQIVFQQAGALRASDLDDLIAQAKELDVNAAAAEEATEQAQ